jgi:hypothetical protein
MQNTPQLISKSSTSTVHLDGVAVVSAIMSSTEPEQFCKEFSNVVKQYVSKCKKHTPITGGEKKDTNALIDDIIQRVPLIRQKGPLVHHITSKCIITMALASDFRR